MPRPSIRFAVGDPAGRHSTTWNVWAHGNEVYASSSTMGGVEKYSFHSSTICRRAFTEEHKLPASMEDRLLQRWNRAATVPAGRSEAVALLSLVIPEACLSPHLTKSRKKPKWIAAPEAGNAITIQLLLTREAVGDLEAMLPANHSLIWTAALPNGETLAIRTFQHPWDGNDVVLPANMAAERDLVLPRIFADEPPRSVAFLLFLQPEEAVVFQLSGFWADAGQGLVLFPSADTITRANVIQSTKGVDGGIPL